LQLFPPSNRYYTVVVHSALALSSLIANRDEELEQLFNTIESLTASLLPHARRISTSRAKVEDDLQKRIKRAAVEHTNLLSQFEVEIENEIEQRIAAGEEPRQVNFGDFSCIWTQIPKPQNLKHDRSYRKKDMGVTFLPDDVKMTGHFLKRFRKVWEAKPRAAELVPPPDQLNKLKLICLILQSLEMTDSKLSQLIQRGWNMALPFEQGFLEGIFDADVAKKLRYQQYRAVQRCWPEFGAMKVTAEACQDHQVFESDEPLPLVFESNLQPGSYSKVEVVQDPWDKRKKYVKKYHAEDAVAKDALKKEKRILQKLDHRHIVRCVKSFERKPEWGILLQPVAEGNLLNLFTEYVYRYDSEQRQERRLHMLNMFGCLTRGLQHMKEKSIRHRDIKPENIVYCEDEADIRFIWIDFGVSHDFIKGASSITRGDDIISARYAAPEYNGNNKSYELQTRRNHQDHDYHSDIFSLGIVFLEVLSILVGEGIRGEEEGPFQKCVSNEGPDVRFADHIDDIKSWVEERVNDINNNSAGPDLRDLFVLGGEMIQLDPTARPEIDSVCERLASSPFNSSYFCQECANEVIPAPLPDPKRKSKRPSWSRKTPENSYSAAKRAPSFPADASNAALLRK
jgi:serine/threonine protein kinase